MGREADGLVGAPPIRIIIGEERHVTIDRALRFLGLGTANLRTVPADGQGRMRADALEDALAESSGPTIVCAQAEREHRRHRSPPRHLRPAREVGAWVHVDGAFGMWRPPARLAQLVGRHRARRLWATDAHKWLNVPYDSGLVFCAHRLRTRRRWASMRATWSNQMTASETGDGLEPRLLAGGSGLPRIRGTALARPVGRHGSRRSLLRSARRLPRPSPESRGSRCSTR